MTDLWQESYSPKDVPEPARVIEQQAALLSAKTRGLVHATVSGMPGDPYSESNTWGPLTTSLRYGHGLFRLQCQNQAVPPHELFAFAYDVTLFPVYLSLESQLARELGVEATFVAAHYFHHTQAEDLSQLETLLGSVLRSARLTDLGLAPV